MLLFSCPLFLLFSFIQSSKQMLSFPPPRKKERKLNLPLFPFSLFTSLQIRKKHKGKKINRNFYFSFLLHFHNGNGRKKKCNRFSFFSSFLGKGKWSEETEKFLFSSSSVFRFFSFMEERREEIKC